MYLLNKKDLEEIFSSSFLYENKSFFVIDSSSGTYQTDIVFSSLIEYAKYIKESFNSGHGVIVKNLEKFSYKICQRALEYGIDVDVHMYIVPSKESKSFDFHTDTRNVVVQMVYGEKQFQIKNNGIIDSIVLKSSDHLEIPIGTIHKAVSLGPSCLLSFGINKQINYYVPGGLELQELYTNQLNF